MRDLNPMEIGLVFWAEQSAKITLEQLDALDIHCGHLGVPPALDCESAIGEWTDGIRQHHVEISGIACSYEGEDYANLEAVHKTVGFTPKAVRPERIARTKVVSDFASALNVAAVSCHIGFIPEDTRELLYEDLRDLTRLLCDHCGGHGQNFVLETGQESAEVLLSFIHNVNRPNLKVNFDPANMVMYSSGDPLAALKILSPHVLSVHCKDAHSPTSSAGHLGTECALGDGDVDFPGFLQQLKSMNYQGILTIEREEPDHEKRVTDIKTGISRLNQWKIDLGL
jgi:L-ribulose-5-phosphate 3-epimerase